MDNALLYIGAGYRNADKDGAPAWLILLIFSIPFVIAVSYYVIKNKQVSKKLIVKYKSLVDLAVCILQSKEETSKAEIQSVLKHINENFDRKYAVKLKAHLKENLKENINLNEVLKNLSFSDMRFIKNMNVGVQNLESTYFSFLVKLAISDRFLSKKELETLQIIRKYWRISEKSFYSILAMFNYVSEEELNKQQSAPKQSTSNTKLIRAYQILELNEEATEAEIKTNYRRLIKLYHPDKLKGANELEKKQAKEMFLKVQKAYELIQEKKKF